MECRKACLKKLMEKNKSENVKMPNWDRTEKRPNETCIIPYEIYADKKLVFNEKEVIKTLRQLAREGIVEMKVSTSGTVWWMLKKK